MPSNGRPAIGSQNPYIGREPYHRTGHVTAAVGPVVFMVNVEVAEPLPASTKEAGLSEHVGVDDSAGATEQASETAPLNPSSEPMVTVALADLPRGSGFGVSTISEIEKSFTTWLSATLECFSWWVSPKCVAEMLWRPAARLLTFTANCPDASAPDPSTVVPSLTVTVPVGDTAPRTLAATSTVNLTVSPTVEGLLED
jgi:hypothetical protein